MQKFITKPYLSTMSRSATYIQLFKVLFLALWISGVGHPFGYAFAFVYVSYFYMRESRECQSAVVGLLLGACLQGIFSVYLYILGFTLYFLLIQILRYLDVNIYRSMPWICAFLTLPYSLYAYGVSFEILLPFALSYALVFLEHEEYTWICSEFVLTNVLYGILCLSLAYVVGMFVPIAFQSYVFGCAFLCMAFVSGIKVIFVLETAMLITYPADMQLFLFFQLALFICIWKKERLQTILGIVLFAILFQANLLSSILLFLVGSYVLLHEDVNIPYHVKNYIPRVKKESSTHVLDCQIQNFSGIFQALAKYYEQISSVEKEMLSQMAKALKYTADIVKQADTIQTQRERILQALEGYQYDVQNFILEQDNHGSLAIEMDIRNIKKQELKETLLPLMEVLTRERLQITQKQNHRLRRGCYHIVMENCVPFQIDAYADSQKNMFQSSGDTFSIFRFRNTVICMISDGMGSGEKAAESSRLITGIFQRMVVSGIDKAQAIRCINKLIQSDAYATLDILCFDCAMGKAYIFKSAACPTYLIRNGHLYEVSGSSLPVGIVSSIEPDCYCADMKDGDAYLMVSDGVLLNEICEWMKERNPQNSKQAMDQLMQILAKEKRMDDSTAVLSYVHKA